MKKNNIIIILVILAVIVLVAVLFTFKPAELNIQPASAQTSDTPEPTEAPTPMPGTAILDKKGIVTATVGVAKADDTEEDVETDAPEDAPSPSPSTSPTVSPSPTPSPEPTEAPQEPAKTEYDVFLALSPEEKDAFLNSFESYEAFYQWLVAAQAEYAAIHPESEIKPGETIDLSKLGDQG